MSARPAKKGLHPAVAVVALLIGAGVAGRSILQAMRPPGAPSAGAGEALAPTMPAAADAEAANAPKWHDLLAAHGSFEPGTDVQMAFASIDQVTPIPAAPAMEAAPAIGHGWRGEAPPALKLGVVMLSGTARRAVLDGRVVGVGDRLHDHEVAAIEAGLVTLRRGDRSLTYDFAGTWPREYRDEAARRAAATTAKPESKR